MPKNCLHLFMIKTPLLSLTILLGIIISCNSESSSKTTLEQPNVILIMADDLGYETIGVNGGSSYPTPEIDRLAGVETVPPAYFRPINIVGILKKM